MVRFQLAVWSQDVVKWGSMAKVTYLEFRPGRWVKLVDGKAVGPATEEEVAEWRREKVAPDRIWQDVVEEAEPSEGEPEQAAEAVTAEPKAPRMEQAEIWQDVLTQAGADAEAGGAPEGLAGEGKAPRVEQAAMWQDVLAQAGAEAQPAAAPHIPRRAEEPATTEISRPPAEPRPRRAPKAAPPKAVAEPEPVPTAKAAPAKETAKPRARRRRKAAPPKTEVEPEPVATAKVAKAKPRRATKAVPAEKAAKPEAVPTAAAAPAKVAPEPKPTPGAEAVPAGKSTPAKPAPGRRRATRRRAKKAPLAASADRLAQSYLWMMAGATEDLSTAVRTGLARYEERFNEPAGAVLCHADDLPGLEQAGLSVDVRRGKAVPPRNFWIGPK